MASQNTDSAKSADGADSTDSAKNTDSAKSLMRAIEAILLIESAPRTAESIAEQLQCPPHLATQHIDTLAEKYRRNGHGVEIAISPRGALLIPERRAWEAISTHYRLEEDSRLPKAALETLAIIAYLQPITIPEIERLRGTGVAHSIRFLTEQRLIKASGIKKAPGSPKLYATTSQFLQLYNLTSIDNLPELEESDKLRFLSSH